MIVILKKDLIRKKIPMNEVQNFANFHTCYLPYGLKFFHKSHPKHKLNYSCPSAPIHFDAQICYALQLVSYPLEYSVSKFIFLEIILNINMK